MLAAGYGVARDQLRWTWRPSFRRWTRLTLGRSRPPGIGPRNGLAGCRNGYQVVLAHDSHGSYPVPAYSPGEPEISAEHAARAAEWALGDTIAIPAHGSDIRFVEAGPTSTTLGSAD